MLNRSIAVIVALLLSTGLYACGGGSPVESMPGSSTPFGQLQTAPGGDGPASLPNLAGMPEPLRKLNLAGPAYYEVFFDEILMSQNTAMDGNNLVLDATGGTAYAIWGVHGFDGDNGPTSAQITMTEMEGSYFVAYSDYERGRWEHVGPFHASATCEMPRMGEYICPTAYTSDSGTCYFGIVLPEGSTATVTNVKLGVHGGDLGPDGVWMLFGVGGDDGLTLSWQHSIDYLDPDFAGYLLERADGYVGGFEPLVFAPINIDHFLDTTTVPDNAYRYRICAVDTEDNRSAWYTTFHVVNPGLEAGVVVNLDMPRGPLYGPVEVTFDLSGSYSPSGEPIVNYSINFGGGMENYSGPDPVVTRILQPGCYSMIIQASTAATSGATYRTLKVYPQWEDMPSIVGESQALIPRAGYPRGIVRPATGLASFVTYDMTYPGLLAWQQTPGGDFEPIPIPTEGNILYISEPVIYNDDLLFAATLTDSAKRVALFGFNGEMGYRVVGTLSCDETPVAVATDGSSRYWLFRASEVGGTTNLYITRQDTPYGSTEIINDIGNIKAIDAVYVPGVDQIHLLVSETSHAKTNWYKYDIATESIVSNAELHPAAADCVDLEQNPAAGFPAAAWQAGNDVHYRQLANLPMGFGSVYHPDTSSPNSIRFDLTFSGDTPYCYLSTDAGNGGLYEYKAGDDWDVRNTSGLAITSAEYLALVGQGDPGDLVVLDVDDDYEGHFLLLSDDGTTSEFGGIPRGRWLNWKMHAAAGSSQIHVISQTLFNTNHFTSPDGENWTEQPLIPGSADADITSNNFGEVYLGYSDLGGQVKLDWWDDAFGIWDNQLTETGSCPMISKFSIFNNVALGYYTAADQSLHMQSGTKDIGFAESVYADVDAEPFAGIVLPLHNLYICLAGTTDFYQSRPGLYDLSARAFNYFPLVGSFSPMYVPGSLARQLAAASVPSSYVTYNFDRVIWVTEDGNHQPIRITYPTGGPAEFETLDWEYEPWTTERRKTVSAHQTDGGGAVALFASLDGQQTYMEWGSRGQWERLAVPDLPYSNTHEIVVSDDGRWHIIYHDYLTNELKCLSTTNAVP